MDSRRKVLFVCTGNYYRSRFAEEFFNHLALRGGLDWSADSAGLMVPETRHINPGTLSVHAMNALDARDLMPVARNKEPRQFMPADFEASDRIIALSRSEHFPIVNERYPERLTRFEFWEAEDLHLEDPIVATDLIAAEVQALVDSLA